MARRYHPNSNGEFDKDNSVNQDIYGYYNTENTFQATNEYQSDYFYEKDVVRTSKNENEYFQNPVSHGTELNVLNQGTNVIPQVNFPSISCSPTVIQSSIPPNYDSRHNYGSNYSKSLVSAFSSGGFENEPPLLEELGINFSHIKNKTLASLNPFRKLDTGTLNDADLTGPLLFCFLFGTSLLLSGKVHFGYIYGVATLGWVSIFSILNLMTENGVNFYLTASVLGYCLLPMVLLSAVAVLLQLRGIIGLVLGVTSVSWCTFSSSTYFVTAFGMQNQQILIAYPILLFYSCFALMTIF